jgi:tRNA pseudouridine38-40 synthase
MPAFRLTLAYDGTDYIGWQRQASGVSIQGLLEDALREFGDGEVAVAGAGRTDAGVHASGQVASFTLSRDISAGTVVRALNARLPEAVRVLSAVEAPETFHARFDARAKTYRYRIWHGDVLPPFERRYAWHVPGRLDLQAMQRAAALVEGEHDFAAFQSAGSDVATTVRRVFESRIDCGPRSEGGPPGESMLRATHGAIGKQSARGTPRAAVLEYHVSADGFLRHMVRAIVGSLVDVGRGRQSSDWILKVLQSRDRSAAGRTAPAHGLFLVGVEYPDALAAEP